MRLRDVGLFVVFLAMAIGAQGLVASNAQAVKVLFVGNSYTQANGDNNLTVVFEKLAEEGVPGWNDVSVDMVTQGGHTFGKHLNDAGTPGKPLNAHLVVSPAGTYDWVVLQEQSQTPGFSAVPGSVNWSNSLEAAVDLDVLIQEAGADTVFLMTWGRRDGDDLNAELYPDFLAMQALLDDGYHLYAKETASSDRVTFVAPAGWGFQRVYQDIEVAGQDPLDPAGLFHGLYSGDGSHPSVLGSYLSGAIVYATLTGRDPVGLTWKPDGLTPQERDALLGVAKAVVTDKPYDHFSSIWGPLPRYPWVQPFQAVALGAQDVVFGSDTLRTTLFVDTTEPTINSLSIGAGGGTQGRVGILDGASLKVEGSVVVGGSGEGLLECLGGNLNTESLVVGQAASGAGTVLIDGCTLDVTEVSGGGGEAEMTMLSGQLRARNVGFGWDQVGGTWTLPVDGSNSTVEGPYSLDKQATLRFTMTTPQPDDITFGTLTVQGGTTLRGKIAIDTPGGLTLTEPQDVILMVAETFAIDDLTIGLPPQSTWEIIEYQTVQFALQLHLVPTSASPVSFDPPPGPYDAPIVVTLSTEEPATIHYTTDGSPVSLSSPSGESPIEIELTELGAHTLRAASVNAFGVMSQPSGGSYQLFGPPTVLVDPPTGKYDPPITVTLEASRDGCTIYYTLDGTDPSTKAALEYDAPFDLTENGTITLTARAVADTGLQGPVLEAIYILGDEAPVVEEPTEEDLAEPDTTQPPHDAGMDVAPAPQPTVDEGCRGGQGAPAPAPLVLLLLVTLRALWRRRCAGP